MGSIYRPKYKAKDGEYRESAIYWIKYYAFGKPHRESTGTNNYTEAKRILKKKEGRVADGHKPGVRFDKVRFGDLYPLIREDYERQNCVFR